MPAKTWRGCSSPISIFNSKSLSAFGMRSADNTWPTRRSTFAKSSISIKLVTPTASASVACCIGGVGCASALGSLPWTASASVACAPGASPLFISVMVLFLSIRGKIGFTSPIDFPSSRPPHFNSVGLNVPGDPLSPSCFQISVVDVGITG